MSTLGANSAKLRKMNRKTILDVLLRADSLSVADVSRITGLSIATCANALADMVEYGEALVLENKKSQGGRPARCFAFNPNQFLIAVLLLKAERNKETLSYVITNAYGEIIDSGRGGTSGATLVEIETLISHLLDQHPKLRAAAISVPGVVTDGVIDICDVSSLSGVRLQEHIWTTFGLEAVVDNDINFAATGYFKAYEEKGISGLAYMFFPRDSCMGAGIIVNGRLIRGRTSFAGELSFIPFDNQPRKSSRDRPAPEKFVRHVAQLSVAVTAVIDPDVIVLSGDAVTEEMCDVVRRACLEFIPTKHLPEIVIRSENDRDSLDGMVAAAIEAYLRFSTNEKGDI